jgi:hypothetical protein
VQDENGLIYSTLLHYFISWLILCLYEDLDLHVFFLNISQSFQIFKDYYLRIILFIVKYHNTTVIILNLSAFGGVVNMSFMAEVYLLNNMYVTRALIGRNPCLDQAIQTRKFKMKIF